MEIQRELIQYQQNVTKLQRMVDMIDRAPNNRTQSVWSFIDEVDEQDYRIEDFLLSNAPDEGDRSARSRYDKLSKDFYSLHNKFLEVKEIVSRKQQVVNETR